VLSKKRFKACSVFYTVFSSNLSAAQVVGDTTLIAKLIASMLATDTFLAPPLTEEMLQLSIKDLALGEPPYTQIEAMKRIEKTVETGESQNFELLC